MKNIAEISVPVILCAFILSSCGNTSSDTPDSAPVQTEYVHGSALNVSFANGESSMFHYADGWCNGSMFNVTWRKDNVRFENGIMKLIIDRDAEPKDNVPYSGGEYRTNDFFGYGRYDVTMKAIKNKGVVSSFLTYTGPSDNNPWDEIDIEILGKDTTKVQFNYFTDGKGSHEYLYDLGFDASEDLHTYSFEWKEDSIVWYVDGVQAHSATENIPTTEGRIMMNAWCGKGVDSWLDHFDDTTLPLAAEYSSISYTPITDQTVS